jgi:hypothetical protein
MRYNMTKEERIEALKDDIQKLQKTLDIVVLNTKYKNPLITRLTISQIALIVIENDLIKL